MLDQNVSTLPLNLRRFGLTAYGEPLYRVVWSETRKYIIGGQWPDGAKEYRLAPLYPNMHCWVLEKWLSPEQFTGCSPELYRLRNLDMVSGLFTQGPYPDRGEYQQCFQYPERTIPGDDVVGRTIRHIEAGRAYSYGEKRRVLEDEQSREQEQWFERGWDIFQDSQNAFKNASAMSARTDAKIHRKRNTRVGDVKFGAMDPLGQHGFTAAK